MSHTENENKNDTLNRQNDPTYEELMAAFGPDSEASKAAGGFESQAATSADIDELYVTTTGLFAAMRHRAVVTPAGDQLEETIELPDVAGSRILITRQRRPYDDDPTRIAHEAPRRLDDDEAHNVYHTPVTIQTYGHDGTMEHDLYIEDSGRDGSGKIVPARSHDKANGGTLSVHMPQPVAKELTNQLETVLSYYNSVNLN